jgi:hypothetical protein
MRAKCTDVLRHTRLFNVRPMPTFSTLRAEAPQEAVNASSGGLGKYYWSNYHGCELPRKGYMKLQTYSVIEKVPYTTGIAQSA